MLNQREEELLNNMLTQNQMQMLADSLNKIATKRWFYICVNNSLRADRPHVLTTCRTMDEAYRCSKLYLKSNLRYKNKTLFIEEWARYGKSIAEPLGKVHIA